MTMVTESRRAAGDPEHAVLATFTTLGIDGPVEFTEHPRTGRNQLYDVRCGSQRWFAKTTASAAERWFAASIAPTFPATPPSLSSSTPGTLVTEFVDAPTGFDVSVDDGPAALDVLADLADPLADLHSRDVGTDTPTSEPAWPRLDPVAVDLYLDSTEAARETLRRIHRRPALRAALSKAGDGPRGIIHGDVKLDNVLTGAPPQLIDWELCGVGPTARDLGSVLGSMLSVWIASADFTADDPATWLARSAIPYGRVRSAADRFWRRYHQSATAVPDLATVAAATAEWLVARVWGDSLQLRQANGRLLTRLVVAEGLVRAPHRLVGTAT